MRVLQISSARNFGGGERHFVDLCRGLQMQGHEVFVALRPTNEWQNRLDFIEPENILHVSIRNSFGVLSAMRIAEYVRDNQIDIVHAHVARDYIPASIACLAAPNAKFVLTRHVLFPLKPFNRFALKNLSYAIGVSDAVGTGLKRVFPAEKVRVVANGIDAGNYVGRDAGLLREEFRSLHNIAPDVPLVGTLGELKELKGQRDFVLAAHEISKTHPDTRFVVVGKDNTIDKEFRRELKRLVKVFGLDDRFTWLDWIDDPAPFFAAIDIFVSPSLSESFGLAILEAMFNEKAVVATETEGARQLIGDIRLLAPVSEPIAMAEKMRELLDDPGRCRELGSKLKQRAARSYSLDRMISETIGIYKSVVTTPENAISDQ